MKKAEHYAMKMSRSIIAILVVASLATVSVYGEQPEALYVVEFREDAVYSRYELASQLARQYGGEVQRPDGTTDEVMIRLSPGAARTIALDARIRSVTPVSQSFDGSFKLGNYVYDGSGNIKAISREVRQPGSGVTVTATDRYSYDVLGRLTSATASGGSHAQRYRHDPFGNITSIETTSNGQTIGIYPGVDSQTNRMSRSDGFFNAWSSYDPAGNEVSYLDAPRSTYDMAGSLVSYRGQELYIYTAGDERVARTDLSGISWTYTLRDETGKVLRELSENIERTPRWQWSRDYVYAGGALLASVIPDGAGGQTTRHYHRDHLGTPRLITDATGRRVSEDELHPFGLDLAFNINDPERLHFTGHERDYNGGTATANNDYLDYMHARYYRPVTGRFLAVDPTLASADMTRPQTWNRYAYTVNNPLNSTDPDGRQQVSLMTSPREETARMLVLRGEASAMAEGKIGPYETEIGAKVQVNLLSPEVTCEVSGSVGDAGAKATGTHTWTETADGDFDYSAAAALSGSFARMGSAGTDGSIVAGPESLNLSVKRDPSSAEPGFTSRNVQDAGLAFKIAGVGFTLTLKEQSVSIPLGTGGSLTVGVRVLGFIDYARRSYFSVRNLAANAAYQTSQIPRTP